MSRNIRTLVGAFAALMLAGTACTKFVDNSSSNDNRANVSKPEATAAAPAAATPAKLKTYSIKGIKFAYFKIAAGLKKAELIATAQQLHEQAPDTQLILVDDDSHLTDYINYVKALSGEGELNNALPVEWAHDHIIANVQKHAGGKFVLCEGNGSIEIADLK